MRWKLTIPRALAAILLLHCPAILLAAPGDYWLRLHGLEYWELGIDHDSDGFFSREEYYAGSDPHDPSSVPEPLGDDLSITRSSLIWPGIPGVTYDVASSANLVDWNSSGLTAVGAGVEINVDLTFATDSEFFRLDYASPADEDGDGLSNIEEALLGTDPKDTDTDDDNLSDAREVLVTLTDPLVPNLPGGTIRGTALLDPNNDGDLSDGQAGSGTTVFLDSNYNGTLDDGERTEATDQDGDYEFADVVPGLHHVRQLLPAPRVQTFPEEGHAPTPDFLPDEVSSYVHAAPGVGNFDAPYGENASDFPGEWGRGRRIPERGARR